MPELATILFYLKWAAIVVGVILIFRGLVHAFVLRETVKKAAEQLPAEVRTSQDAVLASTVLVLMPLAGIQSTLEAIVGAVLIVAGNTL
jgi:hypothetical protein